MIMVLLSSQDETESNGASVISLRIKKPRWLTDHPGFFNGSQHDAGLP
ncbi:MULTISPECIES: hypothetical protein [unclassified Methylophaga]|nr:hypothetical protein [Methylophaga sp. UBA678]